MKNDPTGATMTLHEGWSAEVSDVMLPATR
jgi:hypothetical protein